MSHSENVIYIYILSSGGGEKTYLFGPLHTNQIDSVVVHRKGFSTKIICISDSRENTLSMKLFDFALKSLLSF